jgi:hypothetical protein
MICPSLAYSSWAFAAPAPLLAFQRVSDISQQFSEQLATFLSTLLRQ